MLESRFQAYYVLNKLIRKSRESSSNGRCVSLSLNFEASLTTIYILDSWVVARLKARSGFDSQSLNQTRKMLEKKRNFIYSAALNLNKKRILYYSKPFFFM